MNNYPRYKCHKVVNAFKIARISEGLLSESEGSHPVWFLWPTDDNLDPVQVSAAWMEKNKVVIGGYLVIYADGYQSFSPEKAFVEGYAVETKAPDSKFDKVMRKLFLGLIYAASPLVSACCSATSTTASRIRPATRLSTRRAAPPASC